MEGMPALPSSPSPVMVMSPDGLRLATYSWGEEDAPVVLAVHGFASHAIGNFERTGWVRDLGRAGFRVIAFDQRGHGASESPHDPAAYTMELLVDDVLAVLDTYMVDELDYVGYSLGARVGWQVALAVPERLRRVVLGGIPDGEPLTRFDVALARASLASGQPSGDAVTDAYLTMAGAVGDNDLEALICLVEGMRGGPQPDPTDPPQQPVLFATGSEDGILERSRGLAQATPHGTFFEIPGRNHFTAPVSRDFREEAIRFISENSSAGSSS